MNKISKDKLIDAKELISIALRLTCDAEDYLLDVDSDAVEACIMKLQEELRIVCHSYDELLK